MTLKEKQEIYFKKFGQDAPVPPEHILDVVIRDDYEERRKAIIENNPGLVERLTQQLLNSRENPLDPNDPFW